MDRGDVTVNRRDSMALFNTQKFPIEACDLSNENAKYAKN